MSGPYGRVRKGQFLREYAALLSANGAATAASCVLVAPTELAHINGAHASTTSPYNAQTQILLQSLAEVIESKGKAVSPFFNKYGYTKPSFPPYLLTYSAGVIAGLVELSPRPKSGANVVDPQSVTGKQLFLAIYTDGLFKTGLPADKVKAGAVKMALALGLVKAVANIAGNCTWLNR